MTKDKAKSDISNEAFQADGNQLRFPHIIDLGQIDTDINNPSIEKISIMTMSEYKEYVKGDYSPEWTFLKMVNEVKDKNKK